MADVSASPRHYGKVADGARAGLDEGIPQVPKLRSRSLKAFGAIEVARHQFLPGEIQTLPFKGPVINLHLSAPHRLVQRQHDLTRDGLVATNDAAVTPAGVPGYWRTDAASEDMSMLLEEGFFRWVAQEAGIDPDRIEVVPVFSAPDPQIERIGLSLLVQVNLFSCPGCKRPCWRCISLGTTPRWDAAPGESSGAKVASPNAGSNRPPIT